MCDPTITDPFKRLDALLWNTATVLQAWGHRKIVNIKLLMRVANWVIHQLDVAQERRTLDSREIWLRRSLKHALLGMAVLE